MELDTIYNEDCIEGMKRLQDKSIDMILCDLPYGMTACKWDSIVPLNDLWEQYNRIIKDNGAIVLFGSEPFSSNLRMSNIKYYKYDWYWNKPRGTGFLNAKRQPLRDVETISVFYKKQCTYNPQFSKGEPYTNKGGTVSHVMGKGVTTYGHHMKGGEYQNDNDGFRYPKQMIKFGVVERNTLHQTQKPVDLCKYLIKTYTNDGEIVLDNCMGSGTTAIACLETGRHYIGYELDADFYKIAQYRIKDYELTHSE